eukprot:TRINITY_DN9023_c0_g1_i2.p1 TRINITY_DN9023_c0_g1~~TRINITY_DN9023_c0_g1_i2.p1  ORF type:complete len:169 (-),score=21.38 TRINITY_DN9023_c0_g1_i2:76-582(-)
MSSNKTDEVSTLETDANSTRRRRKTAVSEKLEAATTDETPRVVQQKTKPKKKRVLVDDNDSESETNHQSTTSIFSNFGSLFRNTWVYPRQLRADAPITFLLFRYAMITTLFFVFYYLYQTFVFNPLYSVSPKGLHSPEVAREIQSKFCPAGSNIDCSMQLPDNLRALL